MKKLICLILIIFLLPILRVSAADTDIVFRLTGQEAYVGEKSQLTLELLDNPGISAASVNIIYDSQKVKLVSWKAGSAMTADVVTLYDNLYGQARFSFCDTKGYFRAKGEILVLEFESADSLPSETAVYLKTEPRSVYGTSYQSLTVSSNNAVVTFNEIKESFTSDIYKIDTAAMLITGVSEKTTPAEFASAFGCKVTTDCKGDYVGTGTRVTASVGSKTYICTVIVKGDADGSGKIETSDYIRIRKAILRIETYTGVYFSACDVNGNGKIDTADYIAVRRHILRIANMFE